MRIEGAVAVVVGGASGLGEATAKRLAAEGARVVVADLDPGRAATVAEAIDGVPVRVDVADDASMAEAIREATKHGELRIAVNCAGIATPGKLLDREGPLPLERFAQVLNVNLLGTINVLRCAAGAMVTNAPEEPGGDRGVCVVTASIAAFEGQVGQVAYAASKAGVAGVVLPAARELAGRGVRVAGIAPGLFDTPMMAGLPEPVRESLAGTVPHPPRLGDPAEYAELVTQIVGNGMLNGEVIRLDGALRMAPR
jgi:NAD(P)-dependent dehydrogenase (short-subunit alcohol dehydrogenase family)